MTPEELEQRRITVRTSREAIEKYMVFNEELEKTQYALRSLEDKGSIETFLLNMYEEFRSFMKNPIRRFRSMMTFRQRDVWLFQTPEEFEIVKPQVIEILKAREQWLKKQMEEL